MTKPDRVARAGVNVVIDTNSVLDGLLFKDPGIATLTAAVARGTVRWQVCARMREEFARTLDYPALARWAPDSVRLLAQFDRWSHLQSDPPTLPALRCSDPDDQVFLDLAIATSARWLVSHDRALLRLARRAGKLGLHIVKPTLWRLPE